ncbi:hypothetical protein B0H14DRAFT_2572582 [Mycena olivaceomarginata]|nr:hypothetical protein B0H14DRAFT_2572582 [Mycena olivaceomarginata]
MCFRSLRSSTTTITSIPLCLGGGTSDPFTSGQWDELYPHAPIAASLPSPSPDVSDHFSGSEASGNSVYTGLSVPPSLLAESHDRWLPECSPDSGQDDMHSKKKIQERKESMRRQRIEAEQRRRDELRDGYTKLRDVLPPSNQKGSKVSLLTEARKRQSGAAGSNRQAGGRNSTIADQDESVKYE